MGFPSLDKQCFLLQKRDTAFSDYRFGTCSHKEVHIHMQPEGKWFQYMFIQTETVFKHFLKWTILCRAVPSRTMPGWSALRVFKRSCGKWTTMVPFRYTLPPIPRCDTLHTNRARFGFAFRRSYDVSLWHALDYMGGGPPRHASRQARLGTGTVHFRSIQAPLWSSEWLACRSSLALALLAFNGLHANP